MNPSHGGAQTAKYTFTGVTQPGLYRKRAMMAKLFDKHFPHLPVHSKIVEIGPGRGEFAQECIKRGHVYTGIEPAALHADALRAEGFHILHQVVPPLKLADEQFDLIHSMDVIEHLDSYQQVLELLSDCKRALRTGGYISIIAPNFSVLKELFYEYEYQHTYPTTEPRLVQMLEDTGYKVIGKRKFLSELAFTNMIMVDRVLAHVLIPIVRTSIFCAVVRLLASQLVLGKIHKNLCDHVSVLGQKI